MDWLNQLKDLYERVDQFRDAGADHLRAVADWLTKVADATREAADRVDPTPVVGVGVAVKQTAAASAFLAELEAAEVAEESGFGVTATGAAGSGWAAILVPLLAEVVREILRRRRGES